MSWLGQESKVSWPILDFSSVLDITVPVRMFDVTNRAESWKEAVRDIDVQLVRKTRFLSI